MKIYMMQCDENHCTWLVNVETGDRIALEHGMKLLVRSNRHVCPLWPPPEQQAAREP